MDLITVVTIVAAIAGILSSIYIVVVGQKGLLEWWNQRKKIPSPGQERKPFRLKAGRHRRETATHNLPPRQVFFGRDNEKFEILGALETLRPCGAVIHGFAGTGKSALALEVAHLCLEASQKRRHHRDHGLPNFGAFVWFQLSPARELSLNDLLNTIANVLGFLELNRLELHQKQIQVAKLLQTVKSLLIVDNFERVEDSALVDFLLNVPEPTKVLITTRFQQLLQYQNISLRGMSRDEAIALIVDLGKLLELDAFDSNNRELIVKLYEATDGSPMAIYWALGQMKRGKSLEVILGEFQLARGDIFEHLFSHSWRLLTEHSKRILLAMPVFGSSASREAIGAASGIQGHDLTQGIGQLAEMWLLEAPSVLEEKELRYRIHPLTRMFAQTRARLLPETETRSWRGVSTYFLEFSLPHGRCGWEDYDWRAFSYLEKEFPNIMAVVDWGARNQQRRLIVEYARLLMHFLHFKGHWHERVEIGKLALFAAREEGDEIAQAWILVDMLSWIHLERGELEEATELIVEGQSIADQLGLNECLAVAEWHLARIAREEGKYDIATQHLERGLVAASVSRILARLRYERGILAHAINDHSTAQKEYSAALLISQDADDKSGEIRVYVSLGDLALEEGHYDRSESSYFKALRTAETVGRLSSKGKGQLGLALIEERRGHYARALELSKEAQGIFGILGKKPDLVRATAAIERIQQTVEQRRGLPRIWHGRRS